MDKQQYKQYVTDLLNEHNRQSIDELVALYEDRDFILSLIHISEPTRP